MAAMRKPSGETPEPPFGGDMTADGDTPGSTDRRTYKAQYWQAYKSKRPRVFLSLTPEEYRTAAAAAKAAGRRSVAQQIWQESCAYRAQRFLPPRDIEERIRELIVALRRIGDAVAQAAQDRGVVGKLLGERRLTEQLQAIEAEVRAFTERPWRDG